MFKMKKWLYFSSIGALALAGSCAFIVNKAPPQHTSKALSTLDKLTENEKRDLEAFFKYLFFKEGFAFVSEGSIPVSFAGFVDLKNCSQEIIYLLKNVRSEGYSEDNYSEQVVINRGWIVWQTIQDQCSEHNLIMKQVKDDDNYIYLMIINKKNFRLIYNQYKEYFDRELPQATSREALLSSFCNHQYPFTEVLNDNRILKGILLGFGVHNTEQYDRLRKISIQLEMMRSTNSANSEEYKTLVNEEKELSQKLAPVDWSKQFDQKQIRARKFKVEATHEDTQKLIEQYVSDLDKIKSNYKGRDFLEVTLESFFH